MYRSLVTLALVLLLAACGVQRADVKALEATLSSYGSVMRWGKAEQAVPFLDPELPEAARPSDLELERWNQLQVAGWREQPYAMFGETRATQVVEIDLVNRHTQKLKTLVDRQEWRWDAEAQRWWLTSGLPKLEQAR